MDEETKTRITIAKARTWLNCNPGYYRQREDFTFEPVRISKLPECVEFYGRWIKARHPNESRDPNAKGYILM